MMFFLLVLALLLVGGFLWIDPVGLFTTTPEGFSAKKFKSVKSGMTQQEVLQILPSPTKRVQMTWNERCSEVWRYGSKNPVNVLFVDYSVLFGTNGLVTGTVADLEF